MDDTGIYIIKPSIFDDIQSVVFLLQLIINLNSIAMLTVSPTATPAIASEEIAAQSAYKLIFKFLINIAVMQALPYAASKIISLFMKS